MKNKLFYKKGVITGWLFIAIPTLLIFFFSFYPMIQAFLLSLQSGSGTGLTFSGLANYRRLGSNLFDSHEKYLDLFGLSSACHGLVGHVLFRPAQSEIPKAERPVSDDHFFASSDFISRILHGL